MSLDLSSNFLHFKIEMGSGRKGGTYAFNGFKLDADKLMLYRDGVEVSLPPKVLKTLAVLVENRGKILNKNELIEQVWPGVSVEESNLSQHLYILRKVLCEKPGGGPFIETLRRRGYRFTGNVELIDCAAPSVSTPSVIGPANLSGVRRIGNVLRVAEWGPDAEIRTQIKPQTEATEATTYETWRLALKIAGGFLLVMVAVVSAFVWYRVAQPARSMSEISILRLTNGIKPENLTISPAGEYFVYRELAKNGSQHLWLQEVGQSGRFEIDPAGGKYYGGATFSPDGRLVYFTAQEDVVGEAALYRVATIGGPLTKISSDVLGPVSFSPDGREFAFLRVDRSTGLNSLFIADNDGSNERMILGSNSNGRILGLPAWSPDGTMIAFAKSEPNDEFGVLGIYSVGPYDGQIKRLSDEKWETVYRIAWTHDGRGLVMIATRLNEAYTTRRNQVYYLTYPEGRSRRLTTDGSWHQEWSLGVTKDDAVIAAPFNRSSQIWAMDEKGDAATSMQISSGLRDGLGGLAPLPDGRLAFISRSGDEVNIWIMNEDGSGLRQVTSGFQAIEELRADPTGRYLLFSVWKDRHNHLFRLDVDSLDLRQLTFGDGWEVDSTVSADGKSVVYGLERLNEKPALFKISIDGGEPERFGDGECWTPNFSPAGDLLSCIRGGDAREIAVLSVIDGSEIRKFPLPPYSTVNFGARWTPDGRGLVFRRSEKGYYNLWVQPLNGDSPKQLTNFTSGDIYNFAFSADSTKLILARGQQITDAILISNFR